MILSKFGHEMQVGDCDSEQTYQSKYEKTYQLSTWPFVSGNSDAQGYIVEAFRNDKEECSVCAIFSGRLLLVNWGLKKKETEPVCRQIALLRAQIAIERSQSDEMWIEYDSKRCKSEAYSDEIAKLREELANAQTKRIGF